MERRSLLICPHCLEKSSIYQLFKFTLLCNLPYKLTMYLEKLKEKQELKELLRYKFIEIQHILATRELAVWARRSNGRSLEEISREINVTRERIRQIQSKILRKLRNNASKR